MLIVVTLFFLSNIVQHRAYGGPESVVVCVVARNLVYLVGPWYRYQWLSVFDSSDGSGSSGIGMSSNSMVCRRKSCISLLLV